jgi:transposase
MADGLFSADEFESSRGESPETRPGGVLRLRVPQRDQVEMHFASLDEMLQSDHSVRAIWEFVRGLDLSAWLREVRAVEGACGRDATDPRLLLALWVQATVDGVASARELARRCELHLVYQWLCGGVTVNHHLLSDFRSQSGEKLDQLLTKLVATLLSQEVVTLNRVAHDGMRVRASAGRGSFRKRKRLAECLKEAQEQVDALKKLADEDPQELTQRSRSARERAARERMERLQQALLACDDVEQKRRQSHSRHKGKPPKGSSTDPEARIMQMADGGYRPAYNVQLATDVDSGIVVGVEVVNAGSDNGQMKPMAEQIQARYGRSPQEYLADGGFAKLADIDHLETEHECRVYMPVHDEEKKLKAGEDPYARTKSDTDATANWRARMGTDAAKTIYKLRAQSAEWVNANCRNHQLWQLPVRGRVRCRAIALLHALTHNLMQILRLRPTAVIG